MDARAGVGEEGDVARAEGAAEVVAQRLARGLVVAPEGRAAQPAE